MTIIDIVKKFVAKRNPPREDLPDDMTTDKVLRGLRRERRLQIEQKEKEYLRKAIAEHRKSELSKNLYGIGAQGVLKNKEGVRKKKMPSSFFGRGGFL